MVVQEQADARRAEPDLIDTEFPEHSKDIRIGNDLLAATKPFSRESKTKSWWHVSTTFIS